MSFAFPRLWHRLRGALLSILLVPALLVSMPTVAFDSWLALRDAQVVRQARDYSCGAAALATVLTHFYGDPVSEQSLLEQIHDQRIRLEGTDTLTKGLSFAEMASLARDRDYPALGVDVSFDDLKRLAVPVIVALVVDGRAHFSVLRKVDEEDRVFLADPSWGNRQLGRDAFLKSFVRDDERLSGRVLIVGSRDATGAGGIRDREASGVGADDAFRHRPSRRVLIAPLR
ncbi:MAG: cysteine peptidase family C39 domain-containing protein [Congregibacter sp.]|nr:cysteine peptidase family C39 domain-containing protein [Congregibacter sp.]MDP5071114.1 cysteine peptidase family C39 domain-containing protein [Congregibacter sp.]